MKKTITLTARFTNSRLLRRRLSIGVHKHNRKNTNTVVRYDSPHVIGPFQANYASHVDVSLYILWPVAIFHNFPHSHHQIFY